MMIVGTCIHDQDQKARDPQKRSETLKKNKATTPQSDQAESENFLKIGKFLVEKKKWKSGLVFIIVCLRFMHGHGHGRSYDVNVWQVCIPSYLPIFMVVTVANTHTQLWFAQTFRR